MIHDYQVITVKNLAMARRKLGIDLYTLLTDPRLSDARAPLAHSHPHTHTPSEIHPLLQSIMDQAVSTTAGQLVTDSRGDPCWSF